MVSRSPSASPASAIGDPRVGPDAVLAYERWRHGGDPAELDAIAALQRGGLPGHARPARLARGAAAGRNALGARPEPAPPKAETSARLAARRELRLELVDGQEPGSPRWLAGELLEYHRREARPQWWRWFQHLAMDAEALIDDGEAIGGLEPTGAPPMQVKKSLHYEMCFPAQEHKLAAGRAAHDAATGRASRSRRSTTRPGRSRIGRALAAPASRCRGR